MSLRGPLPLWPDGAPGIETATPPFEPTITAFPVPTDRPRGAVVVLPGGGYVGRAPHESAPIAEMINRHGLPAFVCDYRVAPYRHPWPSTDARRAVRWVRHHAVEYGVDPAKVALLGFSAGGHCAATVSVQPGTGDPAAPDLIDRLEGRPDASILCYAVISFEPPLAHEGCVQNLLGHRGSDAERAALSLERQVDAATPPAFLWHTAADEGVKVEHSLRYATALARAGVRFELHVYPTGRHGLGLAPEDPHVATWAQLCGEWLLGREW